jgi:hypothetical protein
VSKLDKYLKTLSIAFTMAAVVGCGSKADKDFKNDIVDNLIENTAASVSQNTVKDTDIDYADAAYQTRLKQVLLLCNTKDLGYLKDNNISVVLDGRLGDQQKVSFGTEILGAYYTAPGQKVLSLWDDGTNETRFGSTDHQDYAARSVSELVRAIKSGTLDQSQPVHYFSSEKMQNGIQSQSAIKWKSADGFNAKAQNANPVLAQAPSVRR